MYNIVHTNERKCLKIDCINDNETRKYNIQYRAKAVGCSKYNIIQIQRATSQNLDTAVLLRLSQTPYALPKR